MSSLDEIERTALDLSGNLGSLYDACADRVIEEPAMISNVEKSEVDKLLHCDLVDRTRHKLDDVLQMVCTSNVQRLNIQLNLAPRIGITAVSNCSFLIDKHTRFLYISYARDEQKLPMDPKDARKYARSSLCHVDATHVITGVRFGIEIIAVLQLPYDNDADNRIHAALRRMVDKLKNPKHDTNLTNEDKQLLGEIKLTKTYSNIQEFTKMTSIIRIYCFFNNLKSTPEKYPPLLYTLRPVQWLYPDKQKGSSLYLPLDKRDSDDLEDYLMKLSKSIQRLKHYFDYEVTDLHLKYFSKKLEKVQQRWYSLQQEYQDEIRRLRKLTIFVYRGSKESSVINEALQKTNDTPLKENLNKLTKLTVDLKNKTKLVKDLQNEHIHYCNIADQEEYENMDEEKIKRTLKKNEEYDQVFCSSDGLKNENDSKWQETINELYKKYKANENQRYLYADFTYCSFELSGMDLLTTSKNTERSKPTGADIDTTKKTTKHISSSSLSQTEQDVNVLLLGESGVGKSTFINALYNYLKYETFQAAESSSLVVLIPVFFVLTTGSNFDEKIVKFGDIDKLKNEEFSELGESVTQYCKSYVFTLPDTDDRKIRIIDTPGFGDTRGLEQDDFNMQHILKYLSNLTHLNAVCFLLKPNASEMNKFFKICLTHLLDFFGGNISQNILFCFTNARSTFYAPGDTANLLKKLLQSTSAKTKIPFKKENTFCFDNESFRYLVALQNSVTFNDLDRNEYKKSWSKSVTDSQRFIQYICVGLPTYDIDTEHQSIRHAHITITNMIRPMLETLRYILRNVVLWETNKFIELKPKELNSPRTTCLKCRYDSIAKGTFRIRPDHPHRIRKICESCSCALDQHQRIDYELEYEYSDRPSSCEKQKMEKTLKIITDASVQFACFVMFVSRSEDDPFLIGITHMIHQENDIHKREESEMNKQLAQALRKFFDRYQQQMDNVEPNTQFTDLSSIYGTIQSIHKISAVKIQMEAVRKTQENIIERYEYVVSDDATHS